MSKRTSKLVKENTLLWLLIASLLTLLSQEVTNGLLRSTRHAIDATSLWSVSGILEGIFLPIAFAALSAVPTLLIFRLRRFPKATSIAIFSAIEGFWLRHIVIMTLPQMNGVFLQILSGLIALPAAFLLIHMLFNKPYSHIKQLSITTAILALTIVVALL